MVGPSVDLAALLDPARGLDPKQITTLAEAYGTAAAVAKQEGSQSRQEVGDGFLAAVSQRAPCRCRNS